MCINGIGSKSLSLSLQKKRKKIVFILGPKKQEATLFVREETEGGEKPS